MATKVLDGRKVEVQTLVVLVSPPLPHSNTWMAEEGSGWKVGDKTPREGQYFKVIHEWVCPKCDYVHGDQFDLDGPCE